MGSKTRFEKEAGCASGLALIERLKATKQWAIYSPLL